eukprot:TRINITY_DN3144_c0_g2_i2.p1 TRINITY_DN3144_c0_g2~~TRINITY_DN3144_c0_g2_i2.p1  ORF type:complete len:1367 (+),score=243.20 TRINITY_DN3144_c0_g2_i2:103-4203(+)
MKGLILFFLVLFVWTIGGVQVSINNLKTTNAVKVVVNDINSCALFDDGSVKCWGSTIDIGDFGSIIPPYLYTDPNIFIGDDEYPSNIGNIFIPTNPSTLSSAVTDICIGSAHACVIVQNRVVCWGQNDAFQLGTNSSSTLDLRSVTEPWVTLVDTPLSIVCGYNFTCVLTSTNNVECWGANPDNDLFLGGKNGSYYAPILPNPGHALSISALAYHACALNNIETAIIVVCWGDNTYSQSGNVTDLQISPFNVTQISVNSLYNLNIITAGLTQTCASSAYQVFCWGFNPVNNITTTSPNLFYDTATQNYITTLSLGPLNGGMIFQTGSDKLRMWGIGENGINAVTNSANQVRPAATPYINFALYGLFSLVSISRYHACAIYSGDVVCWGQGYFGNLGDPNLYSSGIGFGASITSLLPLCIYASLEFVSNNSYIAIQATTGYSPDWAFSITGNCYPQLQLRAISSPNITTLSFAFNGSIHDYVLRVQSNTKVSVTNVTVSLIAANHSALYQSDIFPLSLHVLQGNVNNLNSQIFFPKKYNILCDSTWDNWDYPQYIPQLTLQLADQFSNVIQPNPGETPSEYIYSQMKFLNLGANMSLYDNNMFYNATGYWKIPFRLAPTAAHFQYWFLVTNLLLWPGAQIQYPDQPNLNWIRQNYTFEVGSEFDISASFTSAFSDVPFSLICNKIFMCLTATITDYQSDQVFYSSMTYCSNSSVQFTFSPIYTAKTYTLSTKFQSDYISPQFYNTSVTFIPTVPSYYNVSIASESANFVSLLLVPHDAYSNTYSSCSLSSLSPYPIASSTPSTNPPSTGCQPTSPGTYVAITYFFPLVNNNHPITFTFVSPSAGIFQFNYTPVSIITTSSTTTTTSTTTTSTTTTTPTTSSTTTSTTTTTPTTTTSETTASSSTPSSSTSTSTTTSTTQISDQSIATSTSTSASSSSGSQASTVTSSTTQNSAPNIATSTTSTSTGTGSSSTTETPTTSSTIHTTTTTTNSTIGALTAPIPKSNNAGKFAAGILVPLVVVFAYIAWRINKKRQRRKEEEEKDNNATSGGIRRGSSKKEMLAIELEDIYLYDVVKGEQIGEGAFGKVFKGEWQGVQVALKTVSQASHIQELQEEAAILRKLKHPNVVMFLGIYVDPMDSMTYLVTEFMPDGSLDKVLQANDRYIDLNIIIKMARGAAAGMLQLEKKHIVHCDLSCRNLLVSRVGDEYSVKVSDFGLSKVNLENVSIESESTVIAVKWSALESIKNREFTSKSDVWSFGVTLWEMLSYGKQPYQGMTNLEVVKWLIDGNRLQPPNGTPLSIQKLLARCWRENPAERPTFSEIIAIFDELQNVKPKGVEIEIAPYRYSFLDWKRKSAKEKDNNIYDKTVV